MDNLKNTINHFFHFNIVDTVIIIIISIIIYSAISNLFKKGLKSKIDNKISKKNKTYIRLITSILKYIFIILTTLVILQINGINVSSILAGVGIVGVVIGLAIQDALKDIIRGFNILSDEYFSVGDVIVFNGITAKVVALGLNSTKMQDIKTGNMITVANRNIEQVEIVSKNIYINVPLSYELDIFKAESVMDEIISEIKKIELVTDSSYKGINNFNESSIDYLVMIETKVDSKLQVRRDALSVIFKVLLKNKIEIPYNQLDIHSK